MECTPGPANPKLCCCIGHCLMALWDLGYLWEHPPQGTGLCHYQLHSFWFLKLFSSILFFAQVCPKAQKGKWKCPGVKHRNQVLFRWKLSRENMLPLSRETRRSLAYFAILPKNSSWICCSTQLRMIFIQNSSSYFNFDFLFLFCFVFPCELFILCFTKGV